MSDMFGSATIISIHALLAESDHPHHKSCADRRDFYPRSPCGERQRAKCLIAKCQLFLSTLSLRRATRFALNVKRNLRISIHALLAESDEAMAEQWGNYIRFLSTLSLRRATKNRMTTSKRVLISIHALLAESDSALPVFLG